MSNPHAAEHTCISTEQPLPSGITIKLEEWTVGDIAAMGERGKGGNIDQMIRRCKVLEDPNQIYSAYNMKPGDALNPDKMQTGDRAVTVILQRILTHWKTCGPSFEFSFECKDLDCQDADAKPIPWSVDLRRFLLAKEELIGIRELQPDDELAEFEEEPVLLPDKQALLWASRFGSMPIVLGTNKEVDLTVFLQKLSDEALACWLEGNRFEYLDSHTGKRLWWKIMQGHDENALQKFRKSPNKYKLQALGLRIVEVEEVQSFQKAQWINRWSAGAEDQLQQHINAVEPGIFREFDVCCPRCGTVQEVSFPLDLGFFSPSSRKNKPGMR